MGFRIRLHWRVGEHSAILGPMKALSIKQPWAQLIIIGVKDIENRSQRTSFRGRFAVHVSLKRADYEGVDIEAIPHHLRESVKQAWERNASAGCVIGTIELADCIRDSKSPWAIDDYWHWVLRDPRPYSRSVPAKGRLGLWEWAP
jgi:ASCH domain